MATYYINKSGNDSWDGLSETYTGGSNGPWLTASKASITGTHTIVFGAGVYQPNSVTLNTTKTFQANGIVIFDGGWTIATAFRLYAGSETFRWEGSFVFTGYSDKVIYLQSANDTVHFSHVAFLGMPRAFYFDNSATTLTLSADHCVFWQQTTACFETNINATLSLSNNLFYNTPMVLRTPATGSSAVTLIAEDRGNIYKDCVTIFSFPLATHSLATLFGGAAPLYQDNCYDGITNFAILDHNGDEGGPTYYTTFASFKAAVGSGKFEGDTIEADPQIADVSKELYFLKAASPLLGLGTVLDYIGPFENPIVSCNASNSEGAFTLTDTPATDRGTQWHRVSGVVTLASGRFEGTGVVRSMVFDGGAVRELKRLWALGEETQPTHVFDYDKTDTSPNVLQMRYKISNTTFNQDDTGLSWTTVGRRQEITGVTGRFLQVEITLRDDGVAA